MNLTPKEEDVIKLLSDGLTNYAIAKELGITEDTVKVHVKHILNKLDLNSRSQIIIYYYKNKIFNN